MAAFHIVMPLSQVYDFMFTHFELIVFYTLVV